jgi:hypothetical protein
MTPFTKTFIKLFKGHPKFLVPRLFTLRKGEVFQIPSTCQEVKVLSGVAWITVAGKDIILTPGEKASFVLNKDFALVSALSDVPLMLEALSNNALEVLI